MQGTGSQTPATHENKPTGDCTYAVVPANADVHFGSALTVAATNAIEYTSVSAGATAGASGTWLLQAATATAAASVHASLRKPEETHPRPRFVSRHHRMLPTVPSARMDAPFWGTFLPRPINALYRGCVTVRHRTTRAARARSSIDPPTFHNPPQVDVRLSRPHKRFVIPGCRQRGADRRCASACRIACPAAQEMFARRHPAEGRRRAPTGQSTQRISLAIASALDIPAKAAHRCSGSLP